MNYLVGVCVFERRTDLAGEFNDLLEIVRRRLAQVGTIHQLHNKERKAVVLSHVVDGDNVWMINAAAARASRMKRERCSEVEPSSGEPPRSAITPGLSSSVSPLPLPVPLSPCSPISSVLRPPILSARILTATGRNSSRSVARKTLPIAPRPISLSSR